VEAIRSAIGRGDLQKAVLAHRTLVTASALPGPVEVLQRLQEQAPECTRFAVRRGRTTFLGATPERLVSKSGLSVQTEAIAGSRGPSDALARELLASAKDRGEHEIVVSELLRLLEPISVRLSKSASPRLRELRHVSHLCTAIRAELLRDCHVLDLVERLHPTPAVGGYPRSVALAAIQRHEPAPRGWYAGPIGWFDAAGDGDFCVGLRSGLLEPTTAFVYAGAGIVRDSHRDMEYAETELKMAALLAALGVST
jgi:menaquinone-specific isochorismate synthase